MCDPFCLDQSEDNGVCLEKNAIESYDFLDTHCHICFEIVTLPRVLPCLHSFCHACLEPKLSNCPVCSETIDSNIPLEYYPFDQLKLMCSQEKIHSTSLLCPEDSLTNCDASKQISHSIISNNENIPDLINPGVEKLFSNGHCSLDDKEFDLKLYCSSHANNMVAFVCFTCNSEKLCSVCALSSHSAHEIRSISEYSHESFAIVDNVERKIKIRLKQILNESPLDTTSEILQGMQMDLDDVRAKIGATFDQFTHLLSGIRDSLISDAVKEYNDSTMKVMESRGQTEKWRSNVNTALQFKKRLQECKQHSFMYELIRHCQKRLEKLLKCELVDAKSKLGLRFQAGLESPERELQRIFGFLQHENVAENVEFNGRQIDAFDKLFSKTESINIRDSTNDDLLAASKYPMPITRPILSSENIIKTTTCTVHNNYLGNGSGLFSTARNVFTTNCVSVSTSEPFCNSMWSDLPSHISPPSSVGSGGSGRGRLCDIESTNFDTQWLHLPEPTPCFSGHAVCQRSLELPPSPPLSAGPNAGPLENVSINHALENIMKLSMLDSNNLSPSKDVTLNEYSSALCGNSRLSMNFEPLQNRFEPMRFPSAVSYDVGRSCPILESGRAAYQYRAHRSVIPPSMLSLEFSNELYKPKITTGDFSKNSPMNVKSMFGQLGTAIGHFSSPHGFCLGNNEEIVVADTNNHRIQVFDSEGTVCILWFGISGKNEGCLWYPRKVVVMKQSGNFVVCDRGVDRSRMQLFSPHGFFIRRISIKFIDIVAGLAVSSEGNIVAVDSVTPTVFIISEMGETLRYFNCSDFMSEPSDIAVFGAEFYICDFKGHSVVVLGQDGSFLRRIGKETITSFPNGIDVSDQGDVVVGDSHGNQFHVVIFSRLGEILSQFTCPNVKVSRCCGLKITSRGSIITLAKNNHHVLILDTLQINVR